MNYHNVPHWSHSEKFQDKICSCIRFQWKAVINYTLQILIFKTLSFDVATDDKYLEQFENIDGIVPIF